MSLCGRGIARPNPVAPVYTSRGGVDKPAGRSSNEQVIEVCSRQNDTTLLDSVNAKINVTCGVLQPVFHER